MRELSAEFQAILDSDICRLCWCWTLTRTDNVALGFTDHDRDIDLDGVTHFARSGFTPSALDIREGFAIDNSEVSGTLDHESLNAQTLKSGLYDRAKIILRRVSWEDPSVYDTVWAGRFGKITRSENGFTADLVGPAKALNRGAGRVFSKMCDARLGDARCGVDLSAYPAGATCPRTFEACKSLYGNARNFRGFPYLIGNDALQAGPESLSLRDGSSRYQ